MSKFKVGDKVKSVSDCDYTGEIGVVTKIDGNKTSVTYDNGSECYQSSIEYENGEHRYELVTTKEDKPMARRTFKQIKATPNVKKGALWQEDCDDGTQPYSCITPELVFKDSAAKYHQRTLVEDNPEWFVEVFAVEPQYMTQEELDQWEHFKHVRKVVTKTNGKKPTGVATAVEAKSSAWTPERRAAASRRMKRIRKANKDTWGK